MPNEHINSRQRTIAALSVIKNGEKAPDLLRFMSEDDRLACKKAIESCLKIDPAERDLKLKEQINSLIASDKWSGLAEIHPAWLLEELKNESPRVAGIILRYLPSKHVRYILEHLPPTIKFAIPNVVEAFSVPQPVLEVIKHRFEKRFAPLHLSRAIGQMGFEHLYYLRSDEMEIFFKDLGMQELAMALHGISDKTLNFLFNRLSLKDAKRLQNRIKTLEKVSDAVKRQSRFTVLEIEEDHLGPDKLLLEIGLAAFSRAITSDHQELLRLIEVKLHPSASYSLKRYVTKRVDKNTKATLQERQSIILSRAAALAQENAIDKSWNS